MAGEWAQLTLGDVLTLKRGYDLPAQDRRPGPHPIVSSSGVTGHHAERAIGTFYGTSANVERLGENWRPFRSVACWYLWRTLGNEQLG